MSKAEELLQTVSSTPVVTAGAGEGEEHIVIGMDRVVTVPDALKNIGVQFDHNIETVTFDCPRYWDGIDMSVMKIYVNYMRIDGHVGMHLCNNLIVGDDIMSFDWTISGDVTNVEGNIQFLICIKKTDAEGNEENHWNSRLNEDLYISKGLKCQETVLRRFPDIITQLLTRMDAVEVEQQRWEGATSENLDIWKSDLEKSLSDWQTANEESMAEFKTAMELTQSNWQTSNEEAMSTWKDETSEALDARMKEAEAQVTDEAITEQINEALTTDPSTQATVAQVLNQYLVDNPLAEVAIDSTLTIEGAAADAKAVGDEIKRLEGLIGDVNTILEQLIGGE